MSGKFLQDSTEANNFLAILGNILQLLTKSNNFWQLLAILESYLEHFILFVTYKWAEEVRVFVSRKPFQPNAM
jgi:hypothetical protein